MTKVAKEIALLRGMILLLIEHIDAEMNTSPEAMHIADKLEEALQESKKG